MSNEGAGEVFDEKVTMATPTPIKLKGSPVWEWVISSGLFATVVYYFASLFGSLYHVGYLSAFNILDDEFPGAPDSKVMWGFRAAKYWVYQQFAFIQERNAKVLVPALFFAFVLTLVTWLAVRYERHVKKLRDDFRDFVKAKPWREDVQIFSLVYGVTFASLYYVPTVLIFGAAIVILVPMGGEAIGRQQARQELADWTKAHPDVMSNVQAAANNLVPVVPPAASAAPEVHSWAEPTSAKVLVTVVPGQAASTSRSTEQEKQAAVTPGKPAKETCIRVITPNTTYPCVFLIAESADREAFFDGKFVNVIPAKDASISITAPDVAEPQKQR